MPDSISSLRRKIGNLKDTIYRLEHENELRRQESVRINEEARKAKEEASILRASHSNLDQMLKSVRDSEENLKEKLKATNTVLEETLAVVAKQTGKLTELRIKLHILADGQDIDGELQGVKRFHWTINVPAGTTSRSSPFIKINDADKLDPKDKS